LPPHHTHIDLLYLPLEVKRIPADGARKIGLAPVVDTLPVILVLARRRSYLFLFDEIVQTNRTAILRICLECLLAVAQRLYHKKATLLSIGRDRHKHLNALRFVLPATGLHLRIVPTMITITR
jgi:hypothetical protein